MIASNLRRAALSSMFAVVVGVFGACTSGQADPSKGVYSIEFPSTAAAIATDVVQILVFDVKSPEDRSKLCQDLIVARLTSPDTLEPSVPPTAPANVCELLAGRQEVLVPYGEHALIAVAQKKDAQGAARDFMIGCSIMTLGEGDAPLPISLHLVSVNRGVPATTCGSVGEFCAGTCN